MKISKDENRIYSITDITETEKVYLCIMIDKACDTVMAMNAAMDKFNPPQKEFLLKSFESKLENYCKIKSMLNEATDEPKELNIESVFVHTDD